MLKFDVTEPTVMISNPKTGFQSKHAELYRL